MQFSAVIEDYKKQLENGDSLAVIEKFYDDDIVQVENNAAPLQGKRQLVELEKLNIEKVLHFSLQLVSIIADEVSERVMGEMTVRFHHKKTGKKIIHEAFVQQWGNGKITYQRFYYGAVESEE